MGIQMPELTTMQVKAIFEAACEVAKEGVSVHPEVMIPLTSHVNELRRQRAVLEAEAREVMEEQGVEIGYQFGTMIEVPRAALTADQIAEYAEFLSFGTNDLTQTTFAMSRVGCFDRDAKPLDVDTLPEPFTFATLDEDGVGKIMRLAVTAARKTRADIETGVCGEHGGDPASIAVCDRLGLDYVSCSPYRVPIARLSAAQSALRARS